ncbi:MAG: transcription-repair coupling factor, partial [Beggiatoa sp. IS2]
MNSNFPLSNLFQPIFTCKRGQRQDWGNLCGSSISLVASQIAQQLPVLIITPDTLSAQRLVADIQFFAPTLPTLLFPDWETLPYDIFSPHQDSVSERLATLYRLPDLERGVSVLPVTTLMSRLSPPSYVKNQSLLIQCGQRLNFDKFRRQLEQAGYRCVSQVIEHGEFAIRGSLLDLFPMGSKVPYRIDLLDEEVDSIRIFDPETQRSQGTLTEIRLLPAREFPFNKEGITLFKDQWRAQFSGDPMVSPIYRDISKSLVPAGIEYYFPLFFTQTHTLFDYLPENSVILTLLNVLDVA